jgi:hypothetical protein
LEDGVEAQVGKFTTRGGEVTAAIFSYPTPQMARAKADEFEKSGGYYLKRTGPLLAVIPGGAGTSSGSEVFGDLEWKAQFMWDQATKPPPMPNVASMLVSIFQLTGIMLLVCLGGGGIFALIRVQLRKRRIRLDGSDNPLSFIEIRD